MICKGANGVCFNEADTKEYCPTCEQILYEWASEPTEEEIARQQNAPQAEQAHSDIFF